MKVLIACEFSGVVRRAFRALGHDAFSCDVIPAEDGSVHHIQGDAIDAVLSDSWGLLIAHPPCTYLCNSGVRWLNPGGVLNNERYHEMQRAGLFFAALYHAKIPRVCIENPVMHGKGSTFLKSACGVPTFSQSIQPWQFGHGEVKRTCLWLRGLPNLVPTDIVSGRDPKVHHASPGPNRWKERSRTLPGIAAAMAAQWSV